MTAAYSNNFCEKSGKPYTKKWLTGLFFLFVAAAVSSNAFPQEDVHVYRLKQGSPMSDLSWVSKWKELSVEQTSPTSFQIHWTGYHGSTGELIKDHIFDVQFQGLCSSELRPGQTFTVSLSGQARILKRHGYNPAAYFKLSWNRGLELVDVRPRIPKKPLNDSAVIGPGLDKPTDSREMTFRVRDNNQTDIRLSLVYGGHGELTRCEWEGAGQAPAPVSGACYQFKPGSPMSDLSWVSKWKELSVEQTSPTSFQIHWTGYHGSTGELIKDHIFDVSFQGLSTGQLCPGQTFTVSLSGQARILKRHGYNPAAYFKLGWNRGLELVDVRPRIPKKPLNDSAVIGPGLDKPTDSREMTFRVRDNQTDIRLSLVYGGHGELMRYEWIP